jgi:hypothetical protein
MDQVTTNYNVNVRTCISIFWNILECGLLNTKQPHKNSWQKYNRKMQEKKLEDMKCEMVTENYFPAITISFFPQQCLTFL